MTQSMNDHRGTTPEYMYQCHIYYGKEFKSVFELHVYTPYPCYLSGSFTLLHQLAYFCVVIVAFEEAC